MLIWHIEMFNKLISVIVPLYNKEHHILRAINSIYSQTYKNIEVLIIDDGSTDNSANVVKAINKDNLYLIRQDNKGVSAARNSGIKRSQGEIIAFLDADDEWRTDFLETIIRLITQYSEAGLYATSYATVNSNGTFTLRDLDGIPPSPWCGLIDNYLKIILYSLPICSSSVAIPKKIFSDIGMFMEGEARAEDQEMWFRIALKYRIAYCNLPCATYYQNADNRICKTKFERAPIFFFDTLQKAANNANNRQDAYFISEVLAKNKLYFARKFMECGQFTDAIRLIKNCQTEMFAWEKRVLQAKCHIPLRWIFSLFQIINPKN